MPANAHAHAHAAGNSTSAERAAAVLRVIIARRVQNHQSRRQQQQERHRPVRRRYLRSRLRPSQACPRASFAPSIRDGASRLFALQRGRRYSLKMRPRASKSVNMSKLAQLGENSTLPPSSASSNDAARPPFRSRFRSARRPCKPHLSSVWAIWFAVAPMSTNAFDARVLPGSPPPAA